MFDLFGGLGNGWDPLRDALNMLYNNDSTPSDKGIEIMRLTKNNKVVYVAVVKCPGLERRDIDIQFTASDGEYHPTLRVRGETKTHYGTYKVDVGAVIILNEDIHMRPEGTILKNGILYIYLDPDSAVTPQNKKRDPNNEDFD